MKLFLDVNECEVGTGSSRCDANAKCYKTEESYHCMCIQGFTGNGQTCTGTYNTRKAREGHIIFAANTLQPSGINRRDEPY